MSQLIGRCIDGRYDVTGLLGEGGMGVVLRARHRFTGAEVALKLLHPHIAAMADASARFLAEARSASAIDHPAIVRATDAGKSAEGLYLAMELLDGEPLASAIARGPMAYPAIRQVLSELLDALSAAHAAGFIHRDLKPANVFLARERSGVTVRLLDFGIAKIVADAVETKGKTATGAVMGTLAYMSPEQLHDSRSVDPRTDLWALGVMAFEMATGRLPYQARSFGEMYLAHTTKPPGRLEDELAAIPPGFTALVTRSLAVDVRARFASATEMARAVAALPDGPLTRRSDTRPSSDPFARGADGAPDATFASSPGAAAATRAPLAGTVPHRPNHGPTAIAATTHTTSQATVHGAPPSPPASRRVLVIASVVAVACASVGAASWLHSRGDPSASDSARAAADHEEDDDVRPKTKRSASAPTSARPVPTQALPTSSTAPAGPSACERGCRELVRCGARTTSTCAADCEAGPGSSACVSAALAQANTCSPLAFCTFEGFCGRPLRHGATGCKEAAICEDRCNVQRLGDVACSCACMDGLSDGGVVKLLNNNACAVIACPQECGPGSTRARCLTCAVQRCQAEISACLAH